MCQYSQKNYETGIAMSSRTSQKSHSGGVLYHVYNSVFKYEAGNFKLIDCFVIPADDIFHSPINTILHQMKQNHFRIRACAGVKICLDENEI